LASKELITTVKSFVIRAPVRESEQKLNMKSYKVLIQKLDKPEEQKVFIINHENA
jgi:hypothetical protein